MAAPAHVWGAEFTVIDWSAPGAKSFTEAAGCAIVDIEGPLEQHAGWFCDSYDAIRERVTEALASNAKTVVLNINSPGGDFAGSIELSRDLRAMAAAAGKKLVAFTDSQALSAGYILACAAETITVTPSAFVGSIGVWAPIVDETQRDKAMGLNVVIVASGSRKVDSNPHVAITEDSVAEMQSKVDAMASLFFALVTEQRGLSLDTVIAFQGGQEFGQQAESLHLADFVVNSWGEFLSTAGAQMGKSFEEAKSKAREGLAKVAEGDDEDAKAARALLAKMDGEDASAEDADGDEDAKKKKDEEASAAAGDEEAKAADEEKEAKAADEEDDKKAAARGGLRLASTSSAAEVALAKRVHALEVGIASKAEAEERNTLLATRPDFSKEVRAVFAKAPIATLRDAVKNMPRGTTPAVVSSAKALTPNGTRGDTQIPAEEALDRNGMPKGFVGKSEEDFINEKMSGGLAASTGVVHKGKELVLGFMSPDEARAAAKALATKGAIK